MTQGKMRMLSVFICIGVCKIAFVALSWSRLHKDTYYDKRPILISREEEREDQDEWDDSELGGLNQDVSNITNEAWDRDQESSFMLTRKASQTRTGDWTFASTTKLLGPSHASNREPSTNWTYFSTTSNNTVPTKVQVNNGTWSNESHIVTMILTANTTANGPQNDTTRIGPKDLKGQHNKSTKNATVGPQINASNRILDNQWLRRDEQNKTKPNILFIIADDMRPDIGIYNELLRSQGSPWLNQKMHTPNLDELATQSLLFTRAYSQQAWCNPSRSSFLTSRRPDTTMVHNNTVFFRQNNPNIVSLPQFFKSKGYTTMSAGKVFHLQYGVNGGNDEKFSWSKPCFNARRSEMFETGSHDSWTAVKDSDLQNRKLLDQITAAGVCNMLDHMVQPNSSQRTPFFLAMGLKRPHLPFEFPERFLDFYPLINVSMPVNPTASKNMPSIAWFSSFEVRGKPEFENFRSQWNANDSIPFTIMRDLRRAYYAAISYIDDLIGQVLNKLETTGLRNNTIIVFIGDHGYHLGEQSIVGKNTAFEVAANAPMMISVPRKTANGMVTDRLVEFVDIFPTLVELAGFEKLQYCPKSNANSVDLCTEGTSLLPLIEEGSGKIVRWKDSIFYQYPHYPGSGSRSHVCMGYSIRNVRYRYTEWKPYHYYGTNTPNVNHTSLCGVELYDHQLDPNETINLAHYDDLEAVRAELSAKLKAGWTQALPTR